MFIFQVQAQYTLLEDPASEFVYTLQRGAWLLGHFDINSLQDLLAFEKLKFFMCFSPSEDELQELQFYLVGG